MNRKKIRSDAKCHNCHRLLAESARKDLLPRVECECGWQPKPPSDPSDTEVGRPRKEKPSEYRISVKDDDAPEWFNQLMLVDHEKMLTVEQFSRLFSVGEKTAILPTQIRRWCDAGHIRVVWTNNLYYSSKDEKRSHVRAKGYCYHRREDGGHRRIPESELERCKYLKARRHGSRIEVMPDRLAWRPQPTVQSNPDGMSEPVTASNLKNLSEPKSKSSPLSQSESEIDLSVYEE